MEQRLVAIGDSITLGHWDSGGGWPAVLRRTSDEIVIATGRDQYAAVYNLGISSNKSEDVLRRFEPEVDARLLADEKEQAFIALAVGINDSQLKENKPVVDVEQYRKNLEELVALALARTDRIVVVGLTPVNEALTANPGVTWDQTKAFRNERIAEFNDVASDVARRRDVAFADLFSDGLLGADNVHLDWDGLHLNPQGHERIAHIVGTQLVRMDWRAW